MHTRTNEARSPVQSLAKLRQISVREHLPPRKRILEILFYARSVRSFDLEITQIVVRRKRRLRGIELILFETHRLDGVLIIITVEVVPSQEEERQLHRLVGVSISKFDSHHRRREWVVLFYRTCSGKVERVVIKPCVMQTFSLY